MKYIIIIINILIISLILYQIFIKSENIIESLENCPKNKKNVVFKQEAKLDNLYSQFNTLKNDLLVLEKQIKQNKIKTKENSEDIKATGKQIETTAKAKEKQLDDL